MKNWVPDGSMKVGRLGIPRESLEVPEPSPRVVGAGRASAPAAEAAHHGLQRVLAAQRLGPQWGPYTMGAPWAPHGSMKIRRMEILAAQRLIGAAMGRHYTHRGPMPPWIPGDPVSGWGSLRLSD